MYVVCNSSMKIYEEEWVCLSDRLGPLKFFFFFLDLMPRTIPEARACENDSISMW